MMMLEKLNSQMTLEFYMLLLKGENYKNIMLIISLSKCRDIIIEELTIMQKS